MFDGMSCTQIALERLGIIPERYFACEIDKHAIHVTQKNYPNTIQLGDVTKIDYKSLGGVDLLVGGSPCQGFSFAGKGLNFQDPRSRLFFIFVSALYQIRPKYFLLENVLMKKEHQDVITSYLGVEPIMINSKLVSGQMRKRLYWTNIPEITQPVDRGIVLNDILEKEVDDGFYYSDKALECIIRFEQARKKDLYVWQKNEKFECLTASHHKGYSGQRLHGISQLNPCKKAGGKQPRMQDRIYDSLGKSPALTMFSDRLKILKDLNLRYITPIECERLQNVPDNYTNHVSKTQRYRMLGNGFTVDVIAHILSHIK